VLQPLWCAGCPEVLGRDHSPGAAQNSGDTSCGSGATESVLAGTLLDGAPDQSESGSPVGVRGWVRSLEDLAPLPVAFAVNEIPSVPQHLDSNTYALACSLASMRSVPLLHHLSFHMFVCVCPQTTR
jgi:hypothetical protein